MFSLGKNSLENLKGVDVNIVLTVLETIKISKVDFGKSVRF